MSGRKMQGQDQVEALADYQSDAPEFHAALRSVAIAADSSGRIKATGPDVLDLLHRLSTNSVEHLPVGKAAPTVFTSDRGRIIDLVTVLNLGDYVLVLTSPGNQLLVMEWIERYTFVEDVTLADVTPETTAFSIVGPASASLLERTTGILANGMSLYDIAPITIGDWSGHVLRRSMGHLPCFELVLPADAEDVTREMLESGATSIGSHTMEALRVMLGIPVHGNELGERYNPLEAGLEGAISFSKGCYVGQEVIARLDTYQKVQRRLATLRFGPSSQVHAGSRLKQDGREVGVVTSVARLPDSGNVIGLGFVRNGIGPGDKLSVDDSEEGHSEVMTFSVSLGPTL